MKVISVSCAHCGAPAQIESERKVGFCSYCGAQLLLDDEKQKIELSGQVNVDGMLTLDKQIKNIETLFKIGQADKAYTIIEKLTHEYPEDYRVWWLSIYENISQLYNPNRCKFGEGNPERFLAADYSRMVSFLTETLKTIKISLSLAPPDKKHELGQCASKWLYSYLPYFHWAENRTRLLNSFIKDYYDACNESDIAYRQAKNRRIWCKAAAILIPIAIFLGAAILRDQLQSFFSSVMLLSVGAEFFGILWAKYGSRVDHPWSWYRAKSIARKLPINEGQYLNMFEGTVNTTRRNDENFPVATFISQSAEYISNQTAYFRALADEFANS